MPSQEEYLDQLLKGLTEEPVVEDVPMEETLLQEPVFDVQEELIADPEYPNTEADEDTDILRKMLMENVTLEEAMGEDSFEEDAFEDEASELMSEEEIEQILQDNQNQALQEDETGQDEDLMQLLGETSDGELRDIYEMLHKSDNNEVIDEEMMSLLQGSDMSEADKLQAILEGEESESIETEEGLSPREKKAMEKKRLKEEKALAKQAAKEAKRAQKEAKKAEKQAQKAAQKATGEIARENAEAAAATADEDLFASMDELSTADMLDLQDLLSFADVQMPSEDAISQLQQDAKVQTRPVMKEVPDNQATAIELNAATEADMQEIDELLNLAGITSLDEDSTISFETIDGSDVDAFMVEQGIRDIDAENTSGKGKKGFFAKLLDLLTETDDEEEEGTENIPLSDENRNILEEMDREEKSGKKGKKGKKDKKNKKGAQTELETLDDEEDAPKNKKAAKSKKPKKDKEEKHLKVMPLEDSKNKLPLKVMISTGALCATILVLILLLVNLGGDFAVKREAKQAYYKEDYETCYQTLYGKELNDSEQVMFSKSESILRIRLRMRQYEMFEEEKSEVEALDVLIQTVNDYEDLYAYASKWNAGDEVSETYSRMLAVLQEKYKLTEEDALEIASEPDDVAYTKLVTAVAQGKGYHSPGKKEPVHLPDMLPEEMNFPENNGGQ